MLIALWCDLLPDCLSTAQESENTGDTADGVAPTEQSQAAHLPNAAAAQPQNTQPPMQQQQQQPQVGIVDCLCVTCTEGK